MSRFTTTLKSTGRGVINIIVMSCVRLIYELQQMTAPRDTETRWHCATFLKDLTMHCWIDTWWRLTRDMMDRAGLQKETVMAFSHPFFWDGECLKRTFLMYSGS